MSLVLQLEKSGGHRPGGVRPLLGRFRIFDLVAVGATGIILAGTDEQRQKQQQQQQIQEQQIQEQQIQEQQQQIQEQQIQEQQQQIQEQQQQCQIQKQPVHTGSTQARNGSGGDHRGELLGEGPATAAVVLKIEDRAAPKRQMARELEVYRAWHTQQCNQRLGSAIGWPQQLAPCIAALCGGIPGAWFCTSWDGRDSGGNHPRNSLLTAACLPQQVCQQLSKKQNKKPCVLPHEFSLLAMTRLGPTLEELKQRKVDGRLDERTVLLLGVAMVALLRELHNLGFVHGDLKPENFCIGCLPTKMPPAQDNGDSRRKSEMTTSAAQSKTQLFLIDFGIACHFDVGTKGGHHGNHHAPFDGEQRKQSSTVKSGQVASSTSEDAGSANSTKRRMAGSLRYASIHAHGSHAARKSRRCDIEAIAYVLVYLWRGRLPWQGFRASSRNELAAKIGQAKKEVADSDLCRQCPALGEVLKYCRSLEHLTEPDYEKLANIFITWLQKRGHAPASDTGYGFEWDARDAVVSNDENFAGGTISGRATPTIGTQRAIAPARTKHALYEGLAAPGSVVEHGSATPHDRHGPQRSMKRKTAVLPEASSPTATGGHVPGQSESLALAQSEFSDAQAAKSQSGDSLRRKADAPTKKRVRFSPDPQIERVVSRWMSQSDVRIGRRMEGIRRLGGAVPLASAKEGPGGVSSVEPHSFEPAPWTCWFLTVSDKDSPDLATPLAQALQKIKSYFSRGAKKKLPKALRVLRNLVDTKLSSTNTNLFLDALASAIGGVPAAASLSSDGVTSTNQFAHIHADASRAQFAKLFASIHAKQECFDSAVLPDVLLWCVRGGAYNRLCLADKDHSGDKRQRKASLNMDSASLATVFSPSVQELHSCVGAIRQAAAFLPPSETSSGADPSQAAIFKARLVDCFRVLAPGFPRALTKAPRDQLLDAFRMASNLKGFFAPHVEKQMQQWYATMLARR